ncbi:unnamed protein product [Orchesella dallaii]|uniref:G-protein coupled receptors family 1 profile domain-containing protein n=1 Tax=Orchesella dallaii TaxID=48710 RepID=A0ABP1PM18_9HEXA
MNTTTNETIYVLSDWQCQFMDLANSVKDCSRENPNFCVTCPIEGKFFTGESIRDYYSSGHLICLFMWVLTILIGALGVFTNCLIIGVIRARNKYRPFDYLLMVLAIVDILCCVTAMFAMSAHVSRYQGWVTNSEIVVHWFLNGNVLLLQARNFSTLITVLITIEQFLVIAFPIRSKTWFTSGKTTLLALFTIFVAVFLNFGRYFGNNVEANIYRNIESLENFEYLLLEGESPVFYIISDDINPILLLEFWAPLPILLVFNGLSFTLVRRISKRRREMNTVQQKGIDALRMFLPVVIALLITNIVQIAHLYPLIFLGAIYRELISAFGLSVAVNSSVNFHIFYHQRPKFQQESKAVLRIWFCGQCTRVLATEDVQLKSHRTAEI